MKALVTGATGFIGRRLVPRLVGGGADLACLVKPPATPLEAEALASFRRAGLCLIEGDLMRQPVADAPPPAVDVVFHLAANIDTAATEDALRVNHEGTSYLLDWLRPVSRGARLLYASSVAVHDRDRQPAGPIREDSPFAPRTAYGRTKLEGERILQQRAAADGYSWTIVRLPTVYGPGQKPGGLFDQMITMARTGSLLGRIDWPGKSSIIHVDDAADVMATLAAAPDASGQIYCIASDESLTVGEISRGAGEAVGRPVRPIGLPASVIALLRAAAWNRAVAAMVPAKARLSYWRLSLIVSDGFWFDTTKLRTIYRKPIRSLREGLRDTISTSTHTR
jgi:UDP-glucose 4-epimerase